MPLPTRREFLKTTAVAGAVLTLGERLSRPVQAAETTAYLAAHTGGSHFALGGPAAAADPSAVAISGDDRYQTAAQVAETFFHTPDVAGIATGINFPDALAAGPDLASKDAPLLLVPPSGVLPDGKSFNGAAELKQTLRGRAGLFVNNLTEKMLTYALGRGVERFDKPAVQSIVNDLTANDYRISTLIMDIVKSKPFVMRSARELNQGDPLP